MTNAVAVVVGAGDISRVHLRSLDQLAVPVIAVVDTDADRARAVAADRGLTAATDLRTALADVPDPGSVVVHVCTPHDQHLPVIETALAAGAHVLTEKPLAHRLDDAERIAAMSHDSPSKIGVCLQNRYNPTSLAMRQILVDGDLGPVVSATATVAWSRPRAYYAAKVWAGQVARAGGGALINQSIHTIDLMQWLLGPVTEVAGRAFRLQPIPGVDVEDTATFTMTHSGPDGRARSAMWATNANAGNEPVGIEIVCERGRLSLRGDLTITGPSGTRVVSDAPADTAAQSYWGASHQALIGDFYARLGDPEPFWLSPAQALAAQRILTEVYAQSGG